MRPHKVSYKVSYDSVEANDALIATYSRKITLLSEPGRLFIWSQSQASNRKMPVKSKANIIRQIQLRIASGWDGEFRRQRLPHYDLRQSRRSVGERRNAVRAETTTWRRRRSRFRWGRWNDVRLRQRGKAVQNLACSQLAALANEGRTRTRTTASADCQGKVGNCQSKPLFYRHGSAASGLNSIELMHKLYRPLCPGTSALWNHRSAFKLDAISDAQTTVSCVWSVVILHGASRKKTHN